MQRPGRLDAAASSPANVQNRSPEWREAMDWYLMVWHKYAQFDGRSRRKEYWMFAVFNAIAYVVLYVAVFAAFIMNQKTIGIFVACLCVVYGLAALIPGLAVSIRRLHDTSKSGWWLLICLVPMVGGIVLLVLMAIEGDPGNNLYGPNPKMLAQPAMG
jgi:uncharacterized membrane protein YhaH (DUF805 family)